MQVHGLQFYLGKALQGVLNLNLSLRWSSKAEDRTGVVEELRMAA
jgi:hypothetical protein